MFCRVSITVLTTIFMWFSNLLLVCFWFVGNLFWGILGFKCFLIFGKVIPSILQFDKMFIGTQCHIKSENEHRLLFLFYIFFFRLIVSNRMYAMSYLTKIWPCHQKLDAEHNIQDIHYKCLLPIIKFYLFWCAAFLLQVTFSIKFQYYLYFGL